MVRMKIEHDGYTLPVVNRAVWLCERGLRAVEMVHCVAVKIGFRFDVYFCNTVIEGYWRSGGLEGAWKVFEEMPGRDVVTWTSMISGFFGGGCMEEGFVLFWSMRNEGVEVNAVTVMVVLQGCCISARLSEGREVHGFVIKNGLLSDGGVWNSVLSLYSVVGSFGEVESLFSEVQSRDVVSWNILMGFIGSVGDIKMLAERFKKMRREVEQSVETLTLVISALAKCGDLNGGEMIHCLSIKSGRQDVVLLASLLDFYSKSGQLRNATRLFSEIPNRNNISWATMMSGFIQNGCFQEAIDLLQQMQAAGLKPETEVLKSLIDVCTRLCALRLSKEVHGYYTRNLYKRYMDENAELETSILNMYIRCGDIFYARLWFDNINLKDVVTWTSMIEGYGIHGLGYDALEIFYSMIDEGVKPNSITFLSLLSAFSHSGLLKEGCEMLYSMKWSYRIEPDLDHYTCLVDLLGRAGSLKEAFTIILKMVAFPDGRIWGALLAASRIYGNQNLAEYAAKKLFELEPDNIGYYTVLSNVQASVGRWAEVEEIRRVVNDLGLQKKPGTSWFKI